MWYVGRWEGDESVGVWGGGRVMGVWYVGRWEGDESVVCGEVGG